MNSFFSENDFPILNNELQIDEMTFNFGDINHCDNEDDNSIQEIMEDNKRKRKSINPDLLREKNRESAKRSRLKRKNEILTLINKIKYLQKENSEMKEKIHLLCPSCKELFTKFVNSPKPNKETVSTLDSNSLSNIPQSKDANKFIVIKPKRENLSRKITPLLSIVAIFCIILTLYNFNNTNKNLNQRFLEEEEYKERMKLIYREKEIIQKYVRESGAFIKYSDYRFLNDFQLTNNTIDNIYLESEHPIKVIDPFDNYNTCNDDCLSFLHGTNQAKHFIDKENNIILNLYIPIIDNIKDRMKQNKNVFNLAEDYYIVNCLILGYKKISK